jgi:hypothetical protein
MSKSSSVISCCQSSVVSHQSSVVVSRQSSVPSVGSHRIDGRTQISKLKVESMLLDFAFLRFLSIFDEVPDGLLME